MEVNDNIILLTFITEKGLINKLYTRKQWLDKHVDIQDYLYSRYIDSIDNLLEILYRIKNKLDIRPVCKTCGNPVRFDCFSRGYSEHCCIKCVMSDKAVLNKIQATCLEKYGVVHSMKSDAVKQKLKETSLLRYGVTSYTKTAEYLEKTKLTNLKKYGVEFSGQSDNNKEKSKKTCLLKYGVEFSFQSDNNKEKAKLTWLIKYGTDNPSKNSEIIDKIKETKLLLYNDPTFNNKEKTMLTCIEKYGSIDQFNQYKYEQTVKALKRNKNKGMSKTELLTYEYLLTIFEKDDILFNVNIDDRYPYHVDFYIKSIDLFIEINAYWTHGKHLFNPNDINDILLLNKWKEKSKYSLLFKNGVIVWTLTDPKKIQIADENNLNYLPIWSNDINEIKNKINKYLDVQELKFTGNLSCQLCV